MNLREQIAETLWKEYDSQYAGSSRADFIHNAEIILALPSGLEAVKKCEEHPDNYHVFCDTCHGTGEIARNLSISEAMEILVELAKLNPTNFYIYSGERVRVKGA